MLKLIISCVRVYLLIGIVFSLFYRGWISTCVGSCFSHFFVLVILVIHPLHQIPLEFGLGYCLFVGMLLEGSNIPICRYRLHIMVVNCQYKYYVSVGCIRCIFVISPMFFLCILIYYLLCFSYSYNWWCQNDGPKVIIPIFQVWFYCLLRPRSSGVLGCLVIILVPYPVSLLSMFSICSFLCFLLLSSGLFLRVNWASTIYWSYLICNIITIFLSVLPIFLSLL